MVQLIVGEKGKGKTKYMLDKVNTEIKNVSGNIAYLDRSAKHMYELNNKVRLIDVSDYFIDNKDEFLGFIAGIISQDHDLEELYFDSFLTIAGINQHIGSGFMEPTPYLEAVKNFLTIALEFKNLKFIDFGGGYGIPYHKLDDEK